MRLVQVTIPAGKRQAILGALDEEGIDYVLMDETSGREFTNVVSFPLPTNAVEDVLAALGDAGLDDHAYTVVIDAKTVESRRFDALADRYAADEESDARIAREELVAEADNLAPELVPYVIMTVISAIVATAGVLLNSPAVVVGSMVIAPLIGPAMATSVGTVVIDRDLFLRGVRLQVIGFLLAIASAAGFAGLARGVHLVPPGLDVLAIDQVEGRLSPDFLSLGVALGAGVAGAISLSSGVSSALVGVMIAVALIPPTAVMGIGIAWGLPRAVLGAGVLVLVNLISINLAALSVLWFQGYRPGSWLRVDEARSATIRRSAVLVAIILLLSVALGAVTYASFQQGTFEEGARAAVQSELDEGQYRALTLLDFTVEYDNTLPFRQPERIVVTIGRPASGQYTDLPGVLREDIRERTGRTVTVQVRYVEVHDTSTARDSGTVEWRAQSRVGRSGSKPVAVAAAASRSSTPSPVSTLT